MAKPPSTYQLNIWMHQWIASLDHTQLITCVALMSADEDSARELWNYHMIHYVMFQQKKSEKKIISPLQTRFVQCKLRAFKKSMMKFFTFKEDDEEEERDDEEEEWDDAKQVQVIKVNIVKVSVLVLVVSLV